MQHFIIIAVVLVACAGLTQQQQESSTSFLSAARLRSLFNSTDFAYNMFGPNARVTVRGEGGTANRADINEMPILKGLGVSSIIFHMGPCAINLPHVHPRGTELFHVLEGNYITGVLEENGGRYIQNNLTAGMITVFPQGLIHYEQNVACTNATFLSAFSSEDAGVLQIVNRLFDITFTEALTSTLNQDETVVNYLRAALGVNPAKDRGECLKRCGLA